MHSFWKITAGGIAFAAVAAIAYTNGGSGLLTETAGAATPAPAMQAMPVPVSAVVKKTIPIYLDYAARTEAIRSITLQAKVAGYILGQPATDGADIKAGDLLYRIDPRDFQASLDQARAQAQRDTAALDYQRSSLDRGTQLSKTGFLSKDTFDQRSSAVRQGEAALAMDQAAIHSAELNLGNSEIRAPFDGRLGRNQAAAGTLVSAGGPALNTLVQLNPIYVTFNPSETDLVTIEKAKAAGTVRADIMLPGEDQARHHGELTFLDNVVDHNTGTITARATIANDDRSLLPGQYVRVRLAVGEVPDALMVPQVALGSSQLGKYVYVIGEGSKVDLRLVELGPSEGDLISVRKGVSENDQIISGQLQKIGPGMPVQALPAKPASSS
jgi:multidrug efflux system membrane fusion protein